MSTTIVDRWLNSRMTCIWIYCLWICLLCNRGNFHCKRFYLLVCLFFLFLPTALCTFSVGSETHPWTSEPTATSALKTIFLNSRFCLTLLLGENSRATLIAVRTRRILISPPLSSCLHPCSSEEPGSLSRTAEESGASKGEHLSLSLFFIFFLFLHPQWTHIVKSVDQKALSSVCAQNYRLRENNKVAMENNNAVQGLETNFGFQLSSLRA